MTAARVTRLAEPDWPVLAALRLRALCDALGNDDPAYRRESDFTAAQWRRRLREQAQFAAYLDDQPVGLISAQRQDRASVYLYSLWLTPPARGHGLARLLVSSAMDWARAQRVRTVTLRVGIHNRSARGVYESLGFTVIDNESRCRSDEVAMGFSVR